LSDADELRNNGVVKNVGESERTPAVEQTAACGLPAIESADGAEGQRGTRNRVAHSILDHGPSTAADLAERLELTPAAVRRHLDALVAEGVVEPREKRVYGSRSRGRPAKVFALTDAGRDVFYQAYDQLASDALRWIARLAGGGRQGEEAVSEFARARVTAQMERYRDRIAAAAPADRPRVLAQALTEDGFAATTSSAHASAGEQLCQHHCPVAHAAEQFPQLCEAEAEVFSRLLGTHVQRLATIAHGDGVCTTFVPNTQPAERPASAPRTAKRSAARPSAAPTQAPKATKAAGGTSTAASGRNPA
jgi:predicted ArsR family transcriptional regulator